MSTPAISIIHIFSLNFFTLYFLPYVILYLRTIKKWQLQIKTLCLYSISQYLSFFIHVDYYYYIIQISAYLPSHEIDKFDLAVERQATHDIRKVKGMKLLHVAADLCVRFLSWHCVMAEETHDWDVQFFLFSAFDFFSELVVFQHRVFVLTQVLWYDLK